MCRNIRTLHNFEPTGHRGGDPRLGAAVRPQAQRHDQAVARERGRVRAGGGGSCGGAARLLDGLVTAARPRDREVEAAKGRERSAARFAPVSSST